MTPHWETGSQRLVEAQQCTGAVATSGLGASDLLCDLERVSPPPQAMQSVLLWPLRTFPVCAQRSLPRGRRVWILPGAPGFPVNPD